MFMKMKLNIPSDEVLTTYVGPPIKALVADYMGTDDKTMKAAHDYFRDYNMAIGVFNAKLFDGIYAMLKELKENDRKLYIATGKRTYQADVAALNFEIDGFLDGIYGFEPQKGIDDKITLLKTCLETLDVDPKCAAMVGDRRIDIQAGKRNKVLSIGAKYGYASPNELEEEGPDFIANSVSDLKKILLSDGSEL